MDRHQAEMTAIFARELAAMIVESLNMDDVDPDSIDPRSPLFGDGLGLDSLDMLELSLAIQQRYGVKLRADDPRNGQIFSSLQALSEHVSAQQASRS